MKHRLVPFILILAITSAVGRVCAEYIGPQRRTVRRVRDPGNDTWTCTRAGEPPCHLHHPDNPCPDCGGSHPSVEQQQYWCGWAAESCGCSPAWRDEVTSLPPAQVSGSFTCANPGNSGWCLGGAGIDLAAHEPLEGHRITWIEGDPGALCDPDDGADVSCSWAGSMEGAHRVGFWAHSTYGDTSERGWVEWRLDTVPPAPALAVSGGIENGGWYRASGPLTVTVTGSDASSGFAAGSLRLEGGEWAQSVMLTADGIYTFELGAVDAAGNTGSGSGVVRLDSTSPSLSAVFNGAGGEHGWYRSGGAAAASASDSLSGISEVSHRVDSGGWVTGLEAGVAGEGVHTVEWRARDAAGNQATLTQELRIDSTPPTAVILSPQPHEGRHYGGALRISGACSDALSGLARCQVSLDGGGSWQTVSLEEGSWSLDVDTTRIGSPSLRIEVMAVDRAGNTGRADGVIVRLDNSGPEVDIPDRWHFSQTVPLVIRDAGSGIRRAELWVDCAEYGKRRFIWREGWIPREFAWDRHVGEVIAPPGEYPVRLEAWDRMGNHNQDVGIVVVPLPPTPSPTIGITPTGTQEHSTRIPREFATPDFAPESGPVIPSTGREKPEEPVPQEEPPRQEASLVILSIMGLSGLWTGLGLSYVVDRRFTALHRISSELDDLRRMKDSCRRD